jgi:serine/threonine protein kinase
MFRLDLPPEQTADLAAALEDVVSQQPRHPTLAAALAAGVEGKQAYFAQEYVVGDPLDAVIRQAGRAPLDATLVTLGRLAEALDRAAGEGIHHGALHLRDVLMEDGAPRLIDVGVAQALQHAGLRAPVRLPYSAPERVEDRPWGGPADIFALGAIAFELVTGRRIVGPGAPSVWADTVPGADVNALSDVFGRALAIEPGARFASASDLVDALRPILARTQSLPSTVAVPPDVPSAAPVEPEEPTSTPAGKTPGDTEPLPSFLSPGESNEYERVRVPDDDVSADLPLIASAGSAPIFEVAADDRPGSFASRDTSGDSGERVGPSLDARTPAPSQGLASSAMSGPLWTSPQPQAVSERRPFLALLIALIVGIAGGFGWGYWTAWRAAERETTVTAAPVASAPAPLSTPRLSQAPQRVDEPKVIGESKLPAPSRTARRPAAPAAASAASKPASPPRDAGKRNAVAPARSAARPKEQASRTPVATTGSLLVDSRPVGAEVSVDGRSIGVTPVTLDDLSPGDHRVVLRIPGFNLWATTAQVKAGSRTRVAASLEQAQQP